MEVFDYACTDDHDLVIAQGDLAVGESTLQHQRDLLLAMPGDFRQFPVIGAGIRNELLNSINADDLRVIIQREMERDGQRIDRLVITEDNINLVAEYNG